MSIARLKRSALLAPALLVALTSVASADGSTDTRQELRRLRKYIERISKSQALRTLRSDSTLDRVANDNSRALAELAGTVPTGALSYLRFALRRAGVYDAVLRAQAVRYQHGTLPPLRALLPAPSPDGRYTHVGIGIAPLPGSQWIATIVLIRRLVQIRDIDVRSKHWLRICARLLEGRRPQVLLTTPGGAVLHVRPQLRRGRFCTRLPRRGAGRYRLEVTVQHRYGPEVASLFPIWAGVPAPRQPVQRLYPASVQDTLQAEGRLLALINETRRRAKLPLLRASALLQRAARQHSTDMLRRGFFGHLSPRWGGLRQRLRRQGLRDVYASENLSISTSAPRAHDSLLDSPSHRAVLMDPALTAMGIGVVREAGSGLLYITECFARLAQPAGTSRHTWREHDE